MNWVRIVHQISCELGSRVNGDVKGWSIHSSINFLQKNWFQKPTSTHPQLTESGPFERPHAPPPSFQLAPLRFWNCTLLQSAAIAPGVRFGWKCVNLFLWHPCSIHTLSRFESKSCWTVWWFLVSKFLSLGFGSPVHSLTCNSAEGRFRDLWVTPGIQVRGLWLTWKIPLKNFAQGLIRGDIAWGLLQISPKVCSSICSNRCVKRERERERERERGGERGRERERDCERDVD